VAYSIQAPEPHGPGYRLAGSPVSCRQLEADAGTITRRAKHNETRETEPSIKTCIRKQADRVVCRVANCFTSHNDAHCTRMSYMQQIFKKQKERKSTFKSSQRISK